MNVPLEDSEKTDIGTKSVDISILKILGRLSFSVAANSMVNCVYFMILCVQKGEDKKRLISIESIKSLKYCF